MPQPKSTSVFHSALVLSFGSLIALSSCSKVNDMHDATMDMNTQTKKMGNTTEGMAKTTQDMAKTTDGMAQTTDDMDQTTKRMEATTCKMYTSLRQGNSKQSRDNDLTAIRRAKGITEKLELSAKYMQGFEYQVWTPSCADVSPREIVIEQAATELLTGVQPYAKNRSKVTATKQSSDYETLYALAATLHRTNSLQAGFLAGSDEKPMTPLDILIEGLKLNQAKNRGQLDDSNFPSWANIVGKYEKDAEFLLRLRGNFLMAYGYAVADSDKFGDSPGLFKKLWRVGTTKLMNAKWTPNLETRDPTEIRERITVSLKLAKETRDALVSLGIDPMIDQTMLKVWKNADFSKFNIGKMQKGKGDDPARAKAIQDLIEVRAQLFSK